MDSGTFFLPISVDVAKAWEIIEEALEKRNMKHSELVSDRLLMVPYYFFEFITFEEEEKQGEKVVSKVMQGKLVLNPETMEIVEGVGKGISQKWSEKAPHEEHEKVKVKEARLRPGDAERVCQLKTAEMYGKPVEKVKVMNIALFYAPLWEINALIGEQEIPIKVSASSGTILGEEKLPSREKTAAEIASEALEELKDPKAWAQYTKELIKIALKPKKMQTPGLPGVLGKNWVWVVSVLLIAALLIAVFVL